VAENDMVKQLDTESFTGGFQLSGDGDIFFTGGEVVDGVVVCDDDGGSLIVNEISKELMVVNRQGFSDFHTATASICVCIPDWLVVKKYHSKG